LPKLRKKKKVGGVGWQTKKVLGEWKVNKGVMNSIVWREKDAGELGSVMTREILKREGRQRFRGVVLEGIWGESRQNRWPNKKNVRRLPTGPRQGAELIAETGIDC